MRLHLSPPRTSRATHRWHVLRKKHLTKTHGLRHGRNGGFAMLITNRMDIGKQIAHADLMEGAFPYLANETTKTALGRLCGEEAPRNLQIKV